MKTICLLLIIFFSSTILTKELENNAIKLENLVVIENTKPEQLFSDNPYSGNVFVIKDLEENGINSVQDVAAEIPNLNFLGFGMGSFHSILGIRGLTNTPFFSEPSTILYIDDIPYGGTFSYINQTNGIDNIEVYRGPQSALFGKNSYGGVFNVHSRIPENKSKTHFSAQYARFNSWKTEGYIDGALIQDKLFFSLGGTYAHSDGYLQNNFLNNTPDKEEHISGRASLIWKPSPAWSISIMANADDSKNATPHISLISSDDPLEIQSDQNGKLEQNSNTGALRISYEKNDLHFLSVTSRRDWQINPFFLDADLTSTPFLTIQIDQRQTIWNQEFRVNSKLADLDWFIGAFASIEKEEFDRVLTIFGIPEIVHNSRQEDENYAVFANLTYNISDQFRLHTGLRLDYIDKHVDREISTTVRFKKDRDFFHASPKISIDYLLMDDFLIYSSMGLAFKPGGFSVAAESPAFSKYNSESMWANELGFKSQWFENRIWANMALFYYQIDNYQVERFISELDYTIINAEKTTSSGMEIEAGVELIPGLQLETAFGYTHIRFDRFRDPLTKTDLSGNSPPYVPEKTLMIAAQYKSLGGYFVRSEWRWNDKTYFDDANSAAFKEDDYSILNARLGYQDKHFSLYLFGENLTNSEYFSFILPPFNAGTPAKPRTLGVKFSLDY